MSIRTVSFADNEWYHVYTRGVDKRNIFLESVDYERFLMLLYACNSKKPIHISALAGRHQGPALVTVLKQPREEMLVDIGAYALMSNHPHLLLRQRFDGAITAFMQKVGTGYTMFFNKKYERTGALFSSRFKARHIATDQYAHRVVNYIHANPAEIFEPRWKSGVIRDERSLKNKLLAYRFSSLLDYEGVLRPESTILNKDALLDILEEPPSFKTLLEDARIYYREEISQGSP